MASDQKDEKTKSDLEQSSMDPSSSGCRRCDCLSFVQRAGGGVVCDRPACHHTKANHGSIN